MIKYRVCLLKNKGNNGIKLVNVFAKNERLALQKAKRILKIDNDYSVKFIIELE